MVKMRYALALLVALLFVPAATADHSLLHHWPSTTVAVNGGTCVQPCRWLRVVDKTGFGSTWRNQQLKKGLTKMASGITSSVTNYTVVGGAAVTCKLNTTCQTQLEQTAIGTLAAVLCSDCPAFGASIELCGENDVQPYCGTDPQHVTRGLLLLGAGGTVLYNVVWHETAHTFGLNDTDNMNPPPCGVGGQDIMCSSGFTFWNQHSKNVLNAKYGHID